MAEAGLRARKKEQTRRLIAETAARLFAQDGYENVAVIDVARAADVAEQTVYNYFPTKEHLVLGYLATLSPTVRRLCLEMTDHLADAIAVALLESTDLDDPNVAKLHAIALAWVFQTITEETGRRTHQDQTPRQIADQLRPAIIAILDDLDRWPPQVARPRPRGKAEVGARARPVGGRLPAAPARRARRCLGPQRRLAPILSA